MNKLDKTIEDRKKNITNLANNILAMEGQEGIYIGDNDMFPLTHTFAEGIYLREMKMPEGTTIIGKIHKEDHIWFLLKGHIKVATLNGNEEYHAPCYVKSPGGIQRVIHAFTETVWVNVHKNPSNTTDLKELENNIIAKDYLEYEKFKKLK